MTETQQAHAGDWVEVECVLLEPADRSANLPAETAEKPLMMWVKGFAEGRAALGEPVTVETMTGRKVAGKLSAINPGYFHTFGEPIPELQHIGKDLRAQIAAYRAAESAAEGGAPSAAQSASKDGGA
jgi:hypothetical protein